MIDTQRVIAYDYRVPLDARDPLWNEWDEKRRQVYLLRTAVDLPLSADSYVWPSALADRAWDLLPDDDVLRENIIACKNLAALESVIEAARTREGVLIAITEVCAVEHRGAGEPRHLPPTAVFLGYDVMDESNLSVLMNHGHANDPADVIDAWRSQWATRLNEHHLFEDVPAAAAFSEEAKVEDIATTGGDGHGQFCVLGLWALHGSAASRNG